MNLEKHIQLDREAIEAPNLCDRFSSTDLDSIGRVVHDGYLRDKQSRAKWEKRVQAAMDLAMQVQKTKTFPWPNCSNIRFPLVTLAALQFHSRAYPALIQGPEIVKYRVVGEDPTGEETARAGRVATHMSYQCMEEDKAWEEQKDKLLITLPIVGTVFTKSIYNVEKNYKMDETVFAQDLVIDYWAKSVEDAQRKTHIIPFFKNDLHSRMKRGTFRELSKMDWYAKPRIAPQPAMGMNEAKRDARLGQNAPMPDETTPYIGLEQHVNLDLDGDGYAEPYIITIENSSQAVLRLVTGFENEAMIDRNRMGEIISIRATQYFTKYSFIPSPDGGIYDIGFGILLGPLNESVDSIINQLTDAGTMALAKGGFLGRGAKIRGGAYTFGPFEWKRVDSSGDDLRKNIVPLEVGEPSPVLFQLLGLLINYVNRVAGTTDPLVGESTGQNTPASTTRSMEAEGLKVYSAVFKRVWRSMKEEFKKDYILNGLFMPIRSLFGQNQLALREDYLGDPEKICPVADPNVTSEAERLQQAIQLKTAAASTPGYDPDEVERRFLKALKVDAVDKVFPGRQKMGVPESEKIQIQKLKLQGEQQWMAMEQQQFVIQMQEEMRMNSAEIAKLQADIALMLQDQQGDAEDRKVAMMQSILKQAEGRNDFLMKQIDLQMKHLELIRAKFEADAERGDLPGLASPSSNRGAKAAGSSAASAG